MAKKFLATMISLGLLGSFNHGVIAASLPNSESVDFLEAQGRKYAVINFSSNECKVSGQAAQQATLYSCFAIVYPGGKVSSITYMLNSADKGVNNGVKCALSANKDQATLFHTRFSDNQPRAGLGAFAVYAQSRNLTQDGSTYYADIAFPGWWLNQNKHVKEGLVEVRAEDVCGINYYFKPSKRLIDLIENF